MEEHRRVEGRRSYVPSRYRLRLHPTDLMALQEPGGALGADLAESLHGYARHRGYLLTSRPQVLLEGSDALPPGEVEVEADAVTPPRRTTLNGAERPAAPARRPAQEPPPEPYGTQVFVAPTTNAPKAVLAVQVPGRPVGRFPIRSTVRIGRALDNDLVLPDERVSRHHGQISVRLGMLVYTDLGSTNGSFLNGSGVSEIALGPTDVLQLGGSSLTVEGPG